MPNKLWKTPSSTMTCAVKTLERNFHLRSLAKWGGRSRCANQVLLMEGSLCISSSSLTTMTTSSSSSSSTTSLPTEEESHVATDHHDTSLLAQNEIRQVPSQESTNSWRPPSSTRNIMEEESSSSSSSSCCIESSTDLESASNRKRASSLDQELDQQGPTRGDHHDEPVQKQARSTREDSCQTRDRFMSILDRPFQYWHELNMVLKEIHPEWSSYQRGRMIHHLIHFLELKIGKDDYVPTSLLVPTAVVESAWRALVLETTLYLKILHALQDFHAKDRAIIHYSVLLHRQRSSKEIQDQIRRTQSLFLVYFKEIMPLSIDDEPRYSPALIPIYDRQDKSDMTPTFGTVPSQESFQASTITTTTTMIVEVSNSLSLKDLLASLPRQNDTASPQEEHSLFSGEESEGLMGLELVD